uniref:Elongation of very long chain fatty acids protein n=1 Tax=Glossina brevipalpis TaxID=37001 RepID=A0A1A9WMX8_9MUSC
MDTVAESQDALYYYTLSWWYLISVVSLYLAFVLKIGPSKYVWALKNFELFDTVLFVLRKKQNQVTPLHVFHHVSVVLLILLYFLYYRAEAAFFPVYINCFIHILMYAYYLMAAVLDAQFMKRFIFVKKSLTTMQMIQFVFILIWIVFQGTVCSVPRIHIYYFAFMTIVIFYGFYDFYQKSYKGNSNKPRKAK